MKVLNDILGYDLKIYQDTEFFSFSIDSIILSNFCNIKKSDNKIIDLCTGNGVVPLILSKRCDKVIDCIEIQEKLVDLCKESIETNNLNDRINVINGDLRNYFDENYNNYYDIVLCNPPYFKNTSRKDIQNLVYEKRIARHEITLNLNELFSCVKKILKNNGVFYMVHRTERLVEILSLLKQNNLIPKRIFFVHENINKSSDLVFIESKLNGNDGVILDKPFIMYNLDGSKTLKYERLIKEVL